MKKWNVLFLVNKIKDTELKISKEIIEYLQIKEVTVFSEEGIFDTKVYENENVDFSVLLGGDGTILNFSHKYLDKDFPIFGINLGRVGVLTEANIENYKEKLDDLLNGKYFIENRNTIECCITKNGIETKEVAFNEVSILRGKLYKMLLINMYVNSSNKTSFYADGICVATSTGSSAFNLSCGGPLLLPSAKNFVISPVNPQLRTITSLVVNDTDLITIDLHEEVIREPFNEEKPVIVIDGLKMIEIEREDKVNIYKSNKVLKIIKIDGEASLFEPTLKVAMSSQDLFRK